eukprot:4184440-Pyramimonas_sp.AAC.1
MEGTQETVSEWQKDDPTSVAASIDWAMDAPNGFLMMVGGNNAHSQAMVTETIKLRKVSEDHMARNSKNIDPNEDEQQFWEEGLGNIQIGINEAPNFRA